ncbi:MAG: hypothetical protein VSS75_021115 [Candidatus Parabeggiatoa sp.]
MPNFVTEADTPNEVIPNVTDALAALIEQWRNCLCAYGILIYSSIFGKSTQPFISIYNKPLGHKLHYHQLLFWLHCLGVAT